MVPMIRQDWANHLIWGLIVFIVGAALAVAAGFGAHRVTAGLVCSLLAGIAKEIADGISNDAAIESGLTPTHSVDPKDALFTLVGGLLGSASAILGAW